MGTLFRKGSNTKTALVYGSLFGLSVFQIDLNFKLSCEVIVNGDKGCVSIGYNSSVDDMKTKTFYTVQGSKDAARLLGDGTPWPKEANRSNLGEGVYVSSTKEDALNYYDLLSKK